jgi:predicted outer membrane repeat protein
LLLPSALAARTWYIKADGSGDVSTIQAGTDSAQHGDTLLIAAGTYTYSAQGGNAYGMISILRGSADMTIVSESGAAATILDGEFQNRIFFFQGETDLTIDGFTFTRGQAPATGDFNGAAFAAHLSSPVVKNCLFINNTADRGGAYWYGGVGAPHIVGCRFVENTALNGGAMYLINSPGPALVSDCVFERNSATGSGGAIFTYHFGVSIESCVFDANSASAQGGAVYVTRSHPTSVTGVTFVRSSASSGGAIATTALSTLTVDQSILAFGTGGGAAHVDATSALSFRCSDIYGNVGGGWTGPIAAQAGNNGNLSLDPLFCSLESADYTLREDSPCAPNHHPDNVACGTIGRFGVGCAIVPTRSRTWGAIKAIYRK